MKTISLTYALTDGPAIRLTTKMWASTSEAIAWACDRGAVVAMAKVVP